MTRADDELDEYGKRILSPLRQAPPLDHQVAAEAKKQFLLQGDSLRQGLISQTGRADQELKRGKSKIFWMLQRKPLMKALVAGLLAVLVILAGSSFTVYAAQSSLPGEPLYTIKSWSEDIRLSLTFSKKDKLNLTLDYTNRRVEEISRMQAGGKAINNQSSDRFQRELEDALQLAAQLDDTQLQNALWQIKNHAENQGMTMVKLINSLPPQAAPAMLHLQERLNEQIQLSTVGEADPHLFRAKIHERQQKRHGPNHSPSTNQSESAPTDLTITPIPKKEDNNNGNGLNKSTDVPGHGGPGNGHGQSTPGIGNHGPDESSTQQP